MIKLKSINFGEKNWFKDGINFIDCDADWPIRYLPVEESQIDMSTCSPELFERYSSAKTRKEKLLLQADAYFEKMTTDTTITDMAFCVFMQTSLVESSYADWLIRETAGKVERGDPVPEDAPVRSGGVPYRKDKYLSLYKDLTENNLDWADIAVEKCAENGIRPWIYFRMNDLHFVDSYSSPWHDSFYYKAKENGWLIPSEEYGHPLGTSGSVKNLLNFAVPEVREWLLNYIEEVVLRYDAFGFGLDFMRNIYCFDYLNDTGYQELMNDFMRKVRNIITKAEEKFRHDIKLLVRIAHSIDDNYVYGFDVKTWVKEGLVDVIAASCEEVCNSNVDVDEWKNVLGDDVALLIGLDDHLIRWLNKKAEKLYHTKEHHIKGLAASYFSRGADGLYFNNYYAPQRSTTGEFRADGKGTFHTAVTLARHAHPVKASEGLRTLLISSQDIAPIGCPVNDPLPIAIGEEGKQGTDFVLNIGKIRASEYVYLTVGYCSEGNIDTKVTLDGSEPVETAEVPILETEVAGHYYAEVYDLRDADKLVRYRFELGEKKGNMTVHFTSNSEKCDIVSLEISVSPDKLS